MVRPATSTNLQFLFLNRAVFRIWLLSGSRARKNIILVFLNPGNPRNLCFDPILHLCMASGSLIENNAEDESREKHRWGENKFYTRKVYKSKNPATQENHKVATTKDDVNSSIQQPLHSPVQHQEQQISSFESAASGDDTSSLNDNARQQNPPSTSNGDAAAPVNYSTQPIASRVNGNLKGNDGPGRILINVSSKSRQEVQELRNKLAQELDEVRALAKRLDASDVLPAASTVPAASIVGYSQSQLSASNAYTLSGTKRPAAVSDVASAASVRRHLSVSVAPYNVSEVFEKEKRTPKANQFYTNSDFLLAKDKIPPADSHKKSKSGSSKKHRVPKDESLVSPMSKKYAHAFKNCSAILLKLMKHKYGWVFNTPVDARGLGLHDYHIIIKHPMDLGTIKTRLDNGWYKSPREFAEDVRITFKNAMTYNPKGQDVHTMAQELSEIFEERWPSIESEYAFAQQPLDMRVLERSGSTAHTISYKPQVVRALAMKKPKAKDPNKRDMTFEEKQKLSTNLQNLPSEKLDGLVQIIKKRTGSLNQRDDEIEVDIDSVDTETLWELDRFVTNYKKSLSKNKRRAELASIARAMSQKKLPERVNILQFQAFLL